MLKTKPCSVCGSPFHTKGYHKPRKGFKPPKRGLRSESPKTKQKRLEVREQWFKFNPADEDGEWTCYLQISPDCPIKLTLPELDLEHYFSKARRPDLKFDVKNIKPSCKPCNKLKGSRGGDEFGK